MKNDYESLTHTKWRYQYHIVITPMVCNADGENIRTKASATKAKLSRRALLPVYFLFSPESDSRQRMTRQGEHKAVLFQRQLFFRQ